MYLVFLPEKRYEMVISLTLFGLAFKPKCVSSVRAMHKPRSNKGFVCSEMSEADHDARPPEGAALRRHQLRQPRRAHGRRGLHQAMEQVSNLGHLGLHKSVATLDIHGY